MADTITKEQYLIELRKYISTEMKKLEHDNEPIGFWVQFNKDKQAEFDAQLAANNITVVE